ncbi:unnamed protein product [Cylindrotheca closterium]|uniref:Uncharacterized protein n=1 Tax=Cylindrotheca closterium TaxID=2856 RepID=A0AAD2G820_9STRA|nr:unnamed protein product [Cylindrotheca closterium]
MSLPAYLQDDEDDEDADFIPGVGDEDEDFRSDDDDESSETDNDEIPPFLQGFLEADPTNQTIIFKDNESFCLSSESPTGSGWSIHDPLLPRPVTFTGWIGDPDKCIDFKVQILEISEQAVDTLDEKLLQAQHEKLQSELLGGKKMAASPASVDQDQKEAARPAMCQPVKNLPATKQGSTSRGESKLHTFSIVGSTFQKSKVVSFRGVFRPPTNTEDASSLFLICTTKVENAAVATPSNGTATAAKRRRDDDSDNDNYNSGRIKVDYQELIELHEDAMLHQQ